MNYFNKVFTRKEKIINFLRAFLTSHKSVVKTFLKWFTKNWFKGTR